MVTIWSLPFQIHCYFLLALCQQCVRRTDAAYVFMIIWVSLAFIQTKGFIYNEEQVAWFYGHNFGAAGVYADFFLGVVAAHWSVQIEECVPDERSPFLSLLMTIIALGPALMGMNSIAALFYTPWIAMCVIKIGCRSLALQRFETSW